MRAPVENRGSTPTLFPIPLAIGAFIFSALCTPFFQHASFIHDDYIHISYLSDESFSEIWFHPTFKRVRGYYRPFELTVFKAAMLLTHKPAHFQFVTALLVFLGTLCLYQMVPRLIGDRRRVAGAAFSFDFIVLSTVVPLCASTGLSLMWIAAGYNDGFVYAFTAMAMYCTLVRDQLVEQPRPGRRIILSTLAGLFTFLAVASKEHGALAFVQVYLVTAFFGREVPVGEGPLSTVWNNVRVSLFRNWYLVSLALGYGVLRFAMAGEHTPRGLVDPLSLERARWLLSVIPEVFFDETAAWPPHLAGIFALVFAVLVPIHFLRVQGLFVPGMFVYLSAAIALLPSAVTAGHAPNRLFAFALYPLLALLILGRTWEENTYLSTATGRVVLLAIALAGALGLQQTYAARLLESGTFQQEFDRFSYAVAPHVGPIVTALEKGRVIEMRNFPFFKDNEFFLRSAFFAASGARVGRTPTQQRHGPPLILLNRGDQLAPRLEVIDE